MLDYANPLRNVPYQQAKIKNVSGGIISSKQDNVIFNALSQQGMSGGPVLSTHNNKTVCVGVITHLGSVEKIEFSLFTPIKKINEKLDIFAKGWKK